MVKLMKCLMGSIFVFSLLWCGSSLASVNHSVEWPFSNFRARGKLIDGSQVMLQYDININNNKKNSIYRYEYVACTYYLYW